MTADQLLLLSQQHNGHVYTLFDLIDEELSLIEEVTKYDYGEV